MNKINKGNMYEWAKPWNPLGGECPHKCSYCSTNTLKRFPVIAYKYSGPLRLFRDLYKRFPGDPKIIFVCAQNDLFAEEVSAKDILRVIERCHIWHEHKYFFQTKNPFRYLGFLHNFPKGSILCTTIETNREYPQMGNAPSTLLRAYAMAEIEGFEKQVTVEPIMDFDLPQMVELIRTCNPAKVNIGADSKHNHLPEPSKEKVLELIEELEKFTVIDRKTNIERLLK